MCPFLMPVLKTPALEHRWWKMLLFCESPEICRRDSQGRSIFSMVIVRVRAGQLQSIIIDRIYMHIFAMWTHRKALQWPLGGPQRGSAVG